MKRGRPSQTASLVALWRALANDGFTTMPSFSDDAAKAMLSPGWMLTYRLASRRLRRLGASKRRRILSQTDVIPMRVATLDIEIEDAVASGIRQLVILGAGLDTRTFRMRTLEKVAVFEVDHPATQKFKRRKATVLRPLSASLTFVPVDFERDSLWTSLSAVGFRPEEPTVWIWEGVVMYLTDEAMRRTLDDVARCSAPDSRLLVNYHEPVANLRGREQRFRRALLAFWNEPQIGLRTAETMRAEVRRVDFDVLRDTRPPEWARRLGAGEPVGHTANVARILVARKLPVLPLARA